jgi:hypothetical protein
MQAGLKCDQFLKTPGKNPESSPYRYSFCPKKAFFAMRCRNKSDAAYR